MFADRRNLPPGWPSPERIAVIMELIRRRIAECVEEMDARVSCETLPEKCSHRDR
jgi:hypothetical protein